MEERRLILNRLASGETFEGELWRLLDLYEELQKDYDDALSTIGDYSYDLGSAIADLDNEGD